MKKPWNKDAEKEFFLKYMETETPEKLFYITDSDKYLAYWPKGYKGKKGTLQSRNSLIGKFTEKWVADLIQSTVKNKKLFAVQGAVCEELGLTKSSPADVVISVNNDKMQKAKDILTIIEVKMSIVWNWELTKHKPDIILECVGNYKSHQGTPGLLRSDSMLKAIGKSANVRATLNSSNIPIIIVGNTPITSSYYDKVDHLKRIGFIQGFWSINPKPIDTAENIKSTEEKGFYRFDKFNELKTCICDLISKEMNFFSGMKSKKDLGMIIKVANEKTTYTEKAKEFLKLIGG
ncbi:MAG: hypothetical protein GX989_05315 [Firmicutes bacterium]|nr:hypothetical protein [Bacillota bacterium]